MNEQRPIYTSTPVEEYARKFRRRLLDLRVSEEYADLVYQDVLRRAVLVESSFHANILQGGRP